jgi:hypothetical protein
VIRVRFWNEKIIEPVAVEIGEREAGGFVPEGARTALWLEPEEVSHQVRRRR